MRSTGTQKDCKQKQGTAIVVLGYPCFSSHRVALPCIPFLVFLSVSHKENQRKQAEVMGSSGGSEKQGEAESSA